MRTPDEIDAMSDTEAQSHAERLAIQLCGTDRFKTELATRLGYTRVAVNSWFAEGGRPPRLVIMYLETEAARSKAAKTLQQLGSALRSLDDYT